MAATSPSPAPQAPSREWLQEQQGRVVKLTMRTPAFSVSSASDEAVVVGRVWAFDASRDVVVLETGLAPPLPPSMRRTLASAVYEGHAGRAPSNGSVTGFKLVRASLIAQAAALPDDAVGKEAPDVRASLTDIAPVPPEMLATREAAALRKCEERAQQLGPDGVSAEGQAVFDALNKTYVDLLTPDCRAAGTSLISLSWTRSSLYVAYTDRSRGLPTTLPAPMCRSCPASSWNSC